MSELSAGLLALGAFIGGLSLGVVWGWGIGYRERGLPSRT